MRTAPSNFFVAGGTVPRDAQCYVERLADTELLSALKAGQFCYILTSRQMGKSSLMVQMVAKLKREGNLCISIDLTAIGQNLQIEQWYGGIFGRISSQLGREEDLESFWTTHSLLSPLQRLLEYLKELLLAIPDQRFIIFIDEIDVIRSLPFSVDEFFAGIRSCFNRRAEEHIFERLTFCLLGVASPSDLILNPHTTPFNIGKRIDLTDFTADEAAPLSNGFAQSHMRSLLDRVLFWTNGHPYLTQRLCQAIAADTTVNDNAGVDRICQATFLSEEAREQNDNLLFVRDRMLRSNVDVARLLITYRQVLHGRSVRNDEANPVISELKLTGIVRPSGGFLKPSNSIYSTVFDRKWVRENMPRQEVRRRRIAYLQVGSLSSAVVIAMSFLLFFALGERNKSREYARRAIAIASREREARKEADQNAISRSMALTEANRQTRKAFSAAADARSALTQAERERQRADKSLAIADHERHLAKQNLTTALYQKQIADQNRALASRQFSKLKVAQSASLASLKEAQRLREIAEHSSYLADITLAKAEYDLGQVGSTLELLKETEASPYRGFEWGFLNHACHLDILTKDLKTIRNDDVKVSPDGHLMAITEQNGQPARLIDASTGKDLYSFPQKGWINCLSFSGDGSKLAVGSTIDHEVGEVNIWNCLSGKLIKTISNSGDVTAIAFSKIGNAIATSSAKGVVRLWSGQGFSRLVSPGDGDGQNTVVAFSPDDKILAKAGQGSAIRLWDTLSGNEILSIPRLAGYPLSLAFTRDGKHLMACYLTSINAIKVIFWDVPAGQISFTKEWPFRAFSAVCAPDGDEIAMGLPDGSIQIWNLLSGKSKITLRGHSRTVTKLAYAPDGSRLVSFGVDGLLKVWDTRRAVEYEEFPGALCFSQDGRLALVSDGKDWCIKASNSKQTFLKLGTFSEHFRLGAFSRDRRYAALAGDQGLAFVFDLVAGKLASLLQTHLGSITAINFSPDSSRLAITTTSRVVQVFDIKTQREALQLTGHLLRPQCVAYSSDGKKIAAAGYDGHLVLWDVLTGRELRYFEPYRGCIYAVSFSPDGKTIAVATQDTSVLMVDVNTCQVIHEYRGFLGDVCAVAFSPDGKRMVTGERFGVVRLWDTEFKKQILHLQAPGDVGNTIRFSLDGNEIITNDGWNLEAAMPVRWLSQHD